MSETKHKSWLSRWLDKQAEKRIEGYVDQHARKSDGTCDEALERRIRWEVGRRAETGKQLDIYEPLRWTGIRAVLGVLGAGAAKLATDRLEGKSKIIGFGVEIGIIVTTVVNSLIDLTRLYPRWLSGLEGGKNTALMLHEKFDAPPNDQAFTPPPEVKKEPATYKKAPVPPTSLIQQAERKDGNLEKY